MAETTKWQDILQRQKQEHKDLTRKHWLERERFVKEAFKAGQSVRQLAIMTGIAETTVRGYLGGGKAADRTRATEQRDAAAQALREKGMTLRAIGGTLGIGPKTVRAALFRHKRRMERKVDRERLPHLTPEEGRKLPVEALGLSARSLNVLRFAGIVDVGELVRWTEDELLREPKLGRTSLREIQDVLAQMDLYLATKTAG